MPASRFERVAQSSVSGLVHAGSACTLVTVLGLLTATGSESMLLAGVGTAVLAAAMGSYAGGWAWRRFEGSRLVTSTLLLAGSVNAVGTMALSMLAVEGAPLLAFLAATTAFYALCARTLSQQFSLRWTGADPSHAVLGNRMATLLGAYLGASMVALLSQTVAPLSLLFGQGAGAALAMAVVTVRVDTLVPARRRIRLKPFRACYLDLRREGLWAPLFFSALAKSLLLVFLSVLLIIELDGFAKIGTDRVLSVMSLTLSGVFALGVLLFMIFLHGAYQSWRMRAVLVVVPILSLIALSTLAIDASRSAQYVFVLGGFAAVGGLHWPLAALMVSALDAKHRSVRSAVSVGWGGLVGALVALPLAAAVSSLSTIGLLALLIVSVLSISALDGWCKRSFELFLRGKILDGNHLERFQAIAIAPMFRGQPVIDGLLRALEDPNDVIRTNAILALGELQTEPFADTLMAFLNDRNLFVRSAAVRALESTRNRESLKRILHRVVSERHHIMKAQLVGLFRGVQRREVIPLLLHLAKDQNSRVRANAIEALDSIPDLVEAKVFGDYTSDPVPRVRTAALVGLARRLNHEAAERVLETLRGQSDASDSAERMAAIWGLGRLGDVGTLIAALKDAELGVRKVAVRALGQIEDERVVFPLIEQLSVSDEHYNQLTLQALVRRGEQITEQALQPFLELSSPVLLRNLGHLLLRVHVPGCEVFIEQLLAAADPQMQLVALKAIAEHEMTELVDAVKAATRSNHPEVVSASLNTLARLGSRKLANLDELLEHPEPHIRSNALLALARADGEGNREEIAKFVRDPDHRVRAIAGMVLVGMRDPRGGIVLNRMLQSDQKWEIVSALYVLGELRRLEFLPSVLTFQSHTDPDVQRHVAMALQKIDRGLDTDVKKLRSYLDQIERKLQPSLEYLITYLAGSTDEDDRFAVDLLSRLNSGDIRQELLSEASVSVGALGEEVRPLLSEGRLKSLELDDLLGLLDSLSAREPVEQHEKVVRALRRFAPLEDSALARLHRYLERLFARNTETIGQLVELIPIGQEEIVSPLITALRARVVGVFRLVLKIVAVTRPQMATQFLERQLADEIESIEPLVETLRSFELPTVYAPFFEQLATFYGDLPLLAQQPKHHLDIDMILRLMKSDDAELKSMALAGVGDLVTNQFLRVLSETLSHRNPTLQMISLQTLEQIKAILNR
ncbi:MAG: HEAT repeat domain-containing protein [Myxococcales bacterium]|nr:HEAT repeat domain-containing protein [Myxococcales bacterium]